MSNQKPLVLLSMLHWGMGHVTRCFPLIHSLLKLKKELLIVCTPSQKEVLMDHFDGLHYYIASDNMPVYGRSKLETLFQLVKQAPAQLKKINQNKRLVNALVQTNDIELIISDNKYGFCHPKIPSIILTHQLNIQTGLGKWMDFGVNWINKKLLADFQVVGVVDGLEKNHLAGKLSAKNKNIPHAKWIGPFNRLQTQPTKGSKKILIILSGPEPQRSILEKKILLQLPQNHEHITLVRGTKNPLPVDLQNHVQSLSFQNIVHFASLKQLEQLLSETEFVMGRSGYTSLMEWVCGGWKAICIPTPGQAEQEYLAQHLHDKKLIYAVKQSNFNLLETIQKAEAYPFSKDRPTAVGHSEIYKFIASVLLSNDSHIE